MTNSRQRGAGFEREIAAEIRDALGVEVRRDLQQYQVSQRGDLIGVDGWVIECKRRAVQRGQRYDPAWWRQAEEAANAQCCEPVLIVRYDRQKPFCIVKLSSLNADYAEKEDRVEITLGTWLMLVREGWADAEDA